jgi:DNA topoisomerase I
LRFVHGFDPGLSRTGKPGNFGYVTPDGSIVEDPVTLERVRALAIPPAWRSVWIALDPGAHLQATGIDSRGRKQYRYLSSWRHERDELKFREMEDFARVQPALRDRISTHLTADPSATSSRYRRIRSATTSPILG